MALTQSYLVTTKTMESFFAAIQSARAPERFNAKFLGQLEFSSSNDRLWIGVLKGLGFLDESGVPTKRYYAFLDQSESGRVLADAVREAYEDLFAINTKAYDLSVEEIKNKLKTLTQGQKSENVVGLMATTFKALAGAADWSKPTSLMPPSIGLSPDAGSEVTNLLTLSPSTSGGSTAEKSVGVSGLSLRYDVHIHLPESRDPAVFDAIFEALRKHLGA
jgi:Family of unknown function (DUF5343)